MFCVVVSYCDKTPVQAARANERAAADPDLHEEDLIVEFGGPLHVGQPTDAFVFVLLTWLSIAHRELARAVALKVKSRSACGSCSRARNGVAQRTKAVGYGDGYAVRRAAECGVPAQLERLADPFCLLVTGGVLRKEDDDYRFALTRG